MLWPFGDRFVARMERSAIRVRLVTTAIARIRKFGGRPRIELRFIRATEAQDDVSPSGMAAVSRETIRRSSSKFSVAPLGGDRPPEFQAPPASCRRSAPPALPCAGARP